LNRHMAAIRKHMDSAGRRRRLELSPSVLDSDAIDSSDRFNHDIRSDTLYLSSFLLVSHAHSRNT
jgi:hypothetical protein